MASLMAVQIVNDVQVMNAGKNAPRACPIVKLTEMMYAGILVCRMEAGSKEYTQEFIVI